jgi:hypothetical protein
MFELCFSGCKISPNFQIIIIKGNILSQYSLFIIIKSPNFEK